MLQYAHGIFQPFRQWWDQEFGEFEVHFHLPSPPRWSMGSRRILSLSLGTLMLLSLGEHQCSPYLAAEKVHVVPAEAAGCYQGLWGEEKRKAFRMSFPKLFFADLNNTASSRLFSHFQKRWSFQSVFPELCGVISCLQHLKEKCGASETSLLFAVFTTN